MVLLRAAVCVEGLVETYSAMAKEWFFEDIVADVSAVVQRAMCTICTCGIFVILLCRRTTGAGARTQNHPLTAAFQCQEFSPSLKSLKCYVNHV